MATRIGGLRVHAIAFHQGQTRKIVRRKVVLVGHLQDFVVNILLFHLGDKATIDRTIKGLAQHWVSYSVDVIAFGQSGYRSTGCDGHSFNFVLGDGWRAFGACLCQVLRLSLSRLPLAQHILQLNFLARKNGIGVLNATVSR